MSWLLLLPFPGALPLAVLAAGGRAAAAVAARIRRPAADPWECTRPWRRT